MYVRYIFTGRNEVLTKVIFFTPVCHSVHRGGEYLTRYPPPLAKVIFLHLFVILFTGGEYLTRCPPPGTRYTPPPRDQVHPPRGTRYTPPGPGTPPQDQVHPPPDQVHPPPPRDQVHPPPGPGTPPPGLQTPEYSQRSAGTHPTGMHSCGKWESLRCTCSCFTLIKACDLTLPLGESGCVPDRYQQAIFPCRSRQMLGPSLSSARNRKSVTMETRWIDVRLTIVM